MNEALLLTGDEIKPNNLNRVEVTNYFATREDDPPSDFFANNLYVPAGIEVV